MPRGGHFAAFEEPELFASDVIKFVEKVEKHIAAKTAESMTTPESEWILDPCANCKEEKEGKYLIIGEVALSI